MTMDKRLNNEDDERYYDALFAMYPTEGWRRILEDMELLKAGYNRVSDIVDERELYFRKGQLDIIEQILHHQGMSEQAYANKVEEQEGSAQAPTGGRATVVGGE
jgi:hypothetical protein